MGGTDMAPRMARRMRRDGEVRVRRRDRRRRQHEGNLADWPTDVDTYLPPPRVVSTARDLMIATMEQALADLSHPRQYVREHARAWFAWPDPHPDYLYSFSSVADHLGLDAVAIRERLGRLPDMPMLELPRRPSPMLRVTQPRCHHGSLRAEARVLGVIGERRSGLRAETLDAILAA